MKTFSSVAIKIFNESVIKYHIIDKVDQPFTNPYEENKLNGLLYRKNWIDTIQWHYEDLIRDPEINPVVALELKRKIDTSNQLRTDVVEQIDDYFRLKYENVKIKQAAKLNSESPAWAIDRLSILVLKIHHMAEETKRTNAKKDHALRCKDKLRILLEQQTDLSISIDELIADIKNGEKYMKVYKQMKMYNDTELNPILYKTNGA